MGCDIYEVKGFKHNKWQDFQIMFSVVGEDLPCLCTFPSNDEAEKKLGGETIMSLALLGAAIKLAYEGKLEEETFIPQCIPDWIIQQIKMHIIF